MGRRLILTALAAATLCVAAAPAASAQALAICHDGGPGSTKQAAQAVETFLRHMEKVAGLSASSLSGEYHTKRSSCASFVGAQKPPLAVVDLATYLHYRGPWSLTPIAHLGGADATQYHVLVREGSYADLSALSGKKVVAAVPKDTTFLERIVLGKSGLGLDTSFTSKPLKGLRKVAREQADATVVGKDAVDHLDELELPAKLVSIHASAGLPGLTLVRVGAHASGQDGLIGKVKGALPKLCTGDGAKLCKTFGVKSFETADPARFRSLEQAYGG